MSRGIFSPELVRNSQERQTVSLKTLTWSVLIKITHKSCSLVETFLAMPTSNIPRSTDTLELASSSILRSLALGIDQLCTEVYMKSQRC